MSKDEKLINKFQREPLPKDINLDELCKYLGYFGFRIEKRRGKGSHRVAIHDKGGIVYPIPSKNGKTVSFVYLKELNKMIKKLEE